MSLEATLTYRAVTDDFAATSAALLEQVWNELGSWNRPDYDRFLEIVEPLMSGAAQATADLTAGYYATVLETGVTVDTAPILARLPDQLLQPFTGYWHQLTVAPWDEAVQSGASIADATGTDIVHQAARDAAADIDTQVKVKRYRRMLTGKSCRWCQFWSKRVYKTAASATFGHQRCDCLIIPAQDVSDDFVDAFNKSIRDESGYDDDVTITEIREWAADKPRRRT